MKSLEKVTSSLHTLPIEFVYCILDNLGELTAVIHQKT